MADFSKNKYFYHRVALIGTGLIGGSIGIALREKRLVDNIICYDRDPEAGKQAVLRGAADQVAQTLIEAVEGAELIILAVPVLSVVNIIKELLPSVGVKALITDVGSTKASIMKEVESLLTKKTYFIGGHPMAGSEESGIKGADPGLLENAIYVLTPAKDTPLDVLEKFKTMLSEAGAQPLVLDPLTHDQVVASVSHLPHLVASALVQSVAGSGNMELVRTLAAGGFRDSTRIAMANPEMWRDICISNRSALKDVLSEFKKSINDLEGYLLESNAEAIEEYLQQARDYRNSIPYRGRGILPELFEVIVLVRDTPGVIGKLTGLLGEAGINIDAIEILHVRELAGGSIRLGFRNKDNQEKAIKLLNHKGYRTHSSKN